MSKVQEDNIAFYIWTDIDGMAVGYSDDFKLPTPFLPGAKITSYRSFVLVGNTYMGSEQIQYDASL